MSGAASGVWFRTDDAWDGLAESLGLAAMDVREEARGLRFITSRRRIEEFWSRHQSQARPFTLFGSGDFHHLSALWSRQPREPFVLLSFDNHPDWDVRPPFWSCGAWINRALENPLVEEVAVWGCGNTECEFPGRLLGNRRAGKEGHLRVQPWARAGVRYPDWISPITPEDWRRKFTEWVARIAGKKLYITIDLDCLVEQQACTNWENGRFTVDDLLWALAQLREEIEIIGGDICGAWSTPAYSAVFQRFAAWFDHPATRIPTVTERSATAETLQRLWPALTSLPEPMSRDE